MKSTPIPARLSGANETFLQIRRSILSTRLFIRTSRIAQSSLQRQLMTLKQKVAQHPSQASRFKSPLTHRIPITTTTSHSYTRSTYSPILFIPTHYALPITYFQNDVNHSQFNNMQFHAQIQIIRPHTSTLIFMDGSKTAEHVGVAIYVLR